MWPYTRAVQFARTTISSSNIVLYRYACPPLTINSKMLTEKFRQRETYFQHLNHFRYHLKQLLRTLYIDSTSLLLWHGLRLLWAGQWMGGSSWMRAVPNHTPYEGNSLDIEVLTAMFCIILLIRCIGCTKWRRYTHVRYSTSTAGLRWVSCL